MARSSITIRDVAAEAGVSHQTVSRVINDNERVSPETRAKVEAAIENLGYSPSAIARSMGQRGAPASSPALLPTSPTTPLPALSRARNRKRGSMASFCSSASAPDEAIFLPHRAAGAQPPDRGHHGHQSVCRRPFPPPAPTVPLVFAGARPREDARTPWRWMSGGTSQPPTICSSKGIAASPPLPAPWPKIVRKIGWLATNRRSRQPMPLPPTYLVEGDWQGGFWLHGAAPIDAGRNAAHGRFCAQNDQMAVGVIRAAAEMNLAVPDQLSLIGIDDIPMASYLSPPLTTLRQDFAEIGRLLVQLLIEAVNNPTTRNST
ncbi:MAG: LacI family DNA-binding transcriptional regulator [Chloroflexota bacterium]